MAGCNFFIPFSGEPSGILNRAKTAVMSQGGIFEGNETAGHFDVTVLGNTIRGSYKVLPQQLNIVIDSKPFFVPCGTIENFLKKEIGS
ncbi:MAG: hypothetical protein ABJA57_03270 [Ginsengibacter sp.]